VVARGAPQSNLGNLAEACELSECRTLRCGPWLTRIFATKWSLARGCFKLSLWRYRVRVVEARGVAAAFIADARLSDKSKKGRAHEFRTVILQERIQPVLDWFQFRRGTVYKPRFALHVGLRSAVANQVAPLIAWWRDWHKP